MLYIIALAGWLAFAVTLILFFAARGKMDRMTQTYIDVVLYHER